MTDTVPTPPKTPTVPAEPQPPPVAPATYTCQQCGRPVNMRASGAVERTCGCPENTGISANMAAVARGVGTFR